MTEGKQETKEGDILATACDPAADNPLAKAFEPAKTNCDIILGKDYTFHQLHQKRYLTSSLTIVYTTD